MKGLRHLAFGMTAGVVIIVFFHLLQVAEEVFQTLIIFNVFFVCMFFPLNGLLKRKIIVLIIGNVICLFWNTFFYMFVGAVAAHFRDGFNALFAMLNPLLNLLWILSFWSMSLTFLADSTKRRTVVVKSDY